MLTQDDVIQKSPLFKGMEDSDFPSLLHCLGAHEEHFQKGDLIFASDEEVKEIGIIRQGYVETEYLDYDGNRSIISSIKEGGLIGDAFGFTKERRYPFDIVSQCDCRILLLSIDKILHPCSLKIEKQERLLENLLSIVAAKYAALAAKSVLLSRRSTKEKLLAFFYEKAKEAKGLPFTIPFNQQELADYLFVERSGLSLELNKLKKEGILTLSHGYYRLRRPEKEA
jgi:CRP-like cAMP-binding protein